MWKFFLISLIAICIFSSGNAQEKKSKGGELMVTGGALANFIGGAQASYGALTQISYLAVLSESVGLGPSTGFVYTLNSNTGNIGSSTVVPLMLACHITPGTSTFRFFIGLEAGFGIWNRQERATTGFFSTNRYPAGSGLTFAGNLKLGFKAKLSDKVDFVFHGGMLYVPVTPEDFKIASIQGGLNFKFNKQ